MATRPSGLRQPSSVKSSNSNIAAASGGGSGGGNETPATKGGSGIPMSRLPSSNSMRRKIATPAGINPPGSRDSGLATDIDNFIIGDVVYVNGDPTKRGKICFMGEVAFAKGEFAGVVLDLPVGNHDGVVQGKRYFQCASLHGLFTKVNRLTRDPGLESPSTPRAPQSTASSVVMPPDPQISGASVERTPSPSGQNVRATPMRSNSIMGNSTLAIGERVIVASATGGTKIGILKYIGPTEFAPGEWAGVELLTPMGRNNGTVQGKKYFECPEKHGIFVAASKVISSPANKTPRRHGSRESLISVSSLASSAASRSIRRPAARESQCLPTCSLQSVLAEKEKHMERLIKERELDRVDLGTLSRQYEDKILELKRLQVECIGYQQQLANSTGDSETISKLENIIEEERRKLEDLQYTLDEEKIMKADLQTQLESLQANSSTDVKVSEASPTEKAEHNQQLEGLQAQLLKQTEMAKESSLKLTQAQNEIKSLQKTVEELTATNKSKLSEAEESKATKEKLLAASQEEIAAMKKAATDQAEVINKLNKQVSDKKRREDELKEKVQKLEIEYDTTFKQKSALEAEVLDLVNSKTGTSELLTSKINDLSQEIQDLREKLQSTEEDKAVLRRINAEFKSRIAKHEDSEASLKKSLDEATTKAAEEIANLKKESGSAAEAAEKHNSEANKKLEESSKHWESVASTLQVKVDSLEKDVQTSTNTCKEQLENIAKLSSERETISKKLSECEQLLKKVEDMKTVSENKVEEQEKDLLSKTSDLTELQGKVQRLEAEIETTLKQKCALESEMVSLANSKTDTSELLTGKITDLNQEIHELKDKLQTIEEDRAVLRKSNTELKSNVTKQEEEVLALKKAMDEFSAKVNNEQAQSSKEFSEAVEKLKKEKQILESKIKDSEEEASSLKMKVAASEKDLEIGNNASKDHLETIEKLKSEKEVISKRHSEIELLLKSTEDQKVAADKKADLKEKELQSQNNELTEQIRKLNEQLMSTTGDVSGLKAEIENLKTEITQSKASYQEKCDQVSSLEEELVAVKDTLTEENNFAVDLQAKVDSLKKDKASLKERISSYKTDSSRFEEVETGLSQELLSLRSTLEQKNKTIADLKKEVAERKADIESSKASTLDASSPQAHIDFLNSIIVDLQKKNEELNVKVNVLINGGSVNSDANSNRVPQGETSTRTFHTLRMYCDICEKFDLHDTEDCPTQVGEDNNTNTHYGASRGEARPYCDTCEIFGHVTGECDDQETY